MQASKAVLLHGADKDRGSQPQLTAARQYIQEQIDAAQQAAASGTSAQLCTEVTRSIISVESPGASRICLGRHEASIYARLQHLQGRLVPEHFGTLHVEVSPGSELTILVLEHAGYSVTDVQLNSTDVQRQLFAAVDAVHAAGSHLWRSEAGTPAA